MADKALPKKKKTNTWDSLYVIWKTDKMESHEIGFLGSKENKESTSAISPRQLPLVASDLDRRGYVGSMLVIRRVRFRQRPKMALPRRGSIRQRTSWRWSRRRDYAQLRQASCIAYPPESGIDSYGRSGNDDSRQ